MTASLTIILTPYVEMVLYKRMQKFVRWKATKIPLEIPCNIYQVFYFNKTCVVDLNRHTCSCGKWCRLGIVYGHVIAVSRHSKSINYLIWFKYINRLMCFRLPTRHKLCTLPALHQNGKYQIL
uniref:SWIM-type domain-containing protein n=1 Tax=Lactuca sativa TaxID=4236 RepID=A0A9R1VS32_LACSA|nr:hypothetical protein LSAT_V11C400197440 [Lactuca sativa]